ncbi:cation transporter [Tersicoccus sp. Bi-70]|uniref:cation transporter n=1 Tax=Tersicoccus sp. Bi-70 TaxID=1897634 RepID=UPI001E38647B|nr:cation transporter [Tersicoccus sp. Bi-70]
MQRATRFSSDLRAGFVLEWITLAWNVVGVAVLAVLAFRSSSTALAGFGLDSLIEIGASAVVLWELSGSGEARRERALKLIGGAFVALAAWLLVQSVIALVTAHRPEPSPGGIAWTAVTAVSMVVLASLKGRVGRALDNPVLRTEARVTLIDALLAVAVLIGVTADAVLGWWWADPVAGLVIVYYALREAREIFRPHPG